MRRIVDGAINVWSGLGRVPSLLYILIYFVSVPGFALIYAHLPYGFYEQNAKLESGFSSDSQTVVSELCRHFIPADAIPAGDMTFDWKEETYNKARIECGPDLQVNDDRSLAFPVRQTVFRDTTENGLTIRNFKVRTLPVDDFCSRRFVRQLSRMLTDFEQSYDFISFRYADSNAVAYPGTGHVFSFEAQKNVRAWASIDGPPIEPATTAYRDTVHMTRVGRPLYCRIIQLIEGYSGYVETLSDDYGRMLYVSAVIITTLGLGDILPVTADARFWVATEALLGVLLMGLFLNALAYQAGRRRPPAAG